MILIIGIPSESPVQLLAGACEEKQIPFLIFNQRSQAGWIIETDYDNFDNSIISDGNRSVRMKDFTGIYLRTMDHTRVPEYALSENKTSIDEMYIRLFKLLNVVVSPRVVNRPDPMMSNGSKPYQALIIRKYGLDIPETCITSNFEEASAFIAKHKAVIYKSISGTRSIVKKLDEKSLKQLNKIKYCPVQFQEFVTGINVRVHVVGKKVFATKISGDAVDYRYAHTENKSAVPEAFDLDGSTSEKCVSLSAALKLPFSGIDLMLTEDGRTVCFEVNPSPGYSYYELNTNQLISHALAEYLSKS